MRISKLNLSFGGPSTLSCIDFQIDTKERIGILGRNGAGKSSLLKILNGEIIPDEGTISKKPNLSISRLIQETKYPEQGSVFEQVSKGLGDIPILLSNFERCAEKLKKNQNISNIKLLNDAERAFEMAGGWKIHNKIKKIISKFGLDGDSEYPKLSGGIKRKVLLAKAMVSDPDILLLDEPTNHLDISTIEWLENQIIEYHGTVLFITHDRRFLEKLATRIVELDRGQLKSFDCSYQKYLQYKDSEILSESKKNSKFDKYLAQEEIWLRKGIKARRTRNEGRLRALEQLRIERDARRSREKHASFSIKESSRSGRIVIEAKNLKSGFDGKMLIQNFSTKILSGERVGIIGHNGSGKSTLVRILTKKDEPLSGQVCLGTNIKLAFFDQLKESINEESTVIENLQHGSDFVTMGNQKKHIIAYLNDFLFSAKRAQSPAKVLSGGERSRLLLARLFLQPFNLLVLDEPTNDLDLETLDLLQDTLLKFKGTLLLISHDREFLDAVVTSIISFDEDGTLRESVGSYSDWMRQKPKISQTVKGSSKKFKTQIRSYRKKNNNLTYREKEEHKKLTDKIEMLEKESASLQKLLSDPLFFKNEKLIVNKTSEKLSEINTAIESLVERWMELEDRI